MIKVVGEPFSHKGKKYPFAEAVIANGLIFLSGHVALNAEGDMVGTTIEEQTRQVIKNLEHTLQQAGATLGDIVKTMIWIAKEEDFTGFNDVYSEFFMATTPARATVRADLPLTGALIEIDAVAAVPD